MATKIVYIGVVILALIAIFLGYKIYQQQVGITNQTIPSPSVQPEPKPSSIQTNTTTSTSRVQQTSQIVNNSVEEENLVKSALLNATAETRIEYSKKLNRFAIDVTTIEIKDCRPNPLIARVQQDSAPYIRNTDSVEHTLRLGETELKVPAEDTISVKIGKIEQYTNFDCVGGSQGLWIP